MASRSIDRCRDYAREERVLRVVWVVPGFSSDENDWCIPALLDLARTISPSCDLHIVAMRYPYRRDTYTIGKAIVHSIGGGHRGPSHTPGIWRDAARVVRGLRCDVLHAFWAYEPGLIAAWFAKQFPAIISLAGGELTFLPEIRYGLMGRKRTRIPLRWALRRVPVVTAGSRFLLDLAHRAIPHITPKFVPLGVDLKRWPSRSRNAGPLTILNVGSLEPVKGQDVLLRSVSRVLHRSPSARLRIAGGGRELGRLVSLAHQLGIAQSVEFAGPVAHYELPAWYCGATLFAQSSWHEAQGMALLEAAACGLPIAGTAVGALPEFAPAAALQVPVGDEDGLAAVLLRILENRDEAECLGVKARDRVEAGYKVETTAERFLELYRSLM